MTADRNCEHCKLHRKKCEEVDENGACKRCRNKEIDCVLVTPKLKGRPPGTKNSKTPNATNNKKRKRRDEESDDESKGNEPSDQEEEDRSVGEEDTQEGIELGDDAPRQETDEEEMGADTRFSTVVGYHPRTVAVAGGTWVSNPVPVGSGGKGRGGGSFIPAGMPIVLPTTRAEVTPPSQQPSESETSSSPPNKKLRLTLKGKRRGSAKEAFGKW